MGLTQRSDRLSIHGLLIGPVDLPKGSRKRTGLRALGIRIVKSLFHEPSIEDRPIDRTEPNGIAIRPAVRPARTRKELNPSPRAFTDAGVLWFWSSRLEQNTIFEMK